MRKIFDFVVLILAILAGIGGTAYLFDRHILFRIANLCLVAMAFPFVKARFNDLIG